MRNALVSDRAQRAQGSWPSAKAEAANLLRRDERQGEDGELAHAQGHEDHHRGGDHARAPHAAQPVERGHGGPQRHEREQAEPRKRRVQARRRQDDHGQDRERLDRHRGEKNPVHPRFAHVGSRAEHDGPHDEEDEQGDDVRAVGEHAFVRSDVQAAERERRPHAHARKAHDARPQRPVDPEHTCQAIRLGGLGRKRRGLRPVLPVRALHRAPPSSQASSADRRSLRTSCRDSAALPSEFSG